MKKMMILAVLVLAGGMCGFLKADDATPAAPATPPPTGEGWQARDESIWWLERTAAIAGSADASGVKAVLLAKDDLLKSQNPQMAIDYFNKLLYEVKARAVQRQIRFTLYELYRDQGLTDKATDQLQQLMMDQ